MLDKLGTFLFSTSTMNMFAITGPNWFPITTPSTCLYGSDEEIQFECEFKIRRGSREDTSSRKPKNEGNHFKETKMPTLSKKRFHFHVLSKEKRFFSLSISFYCYYKNKMLHKPISINCSPVFSKYASNIIEKVST